MSPSPRRLSGLPLYLIGVLALVLAMGGAATAGAMITGKQIKDNTVTTADVKNGSLLAKDFKKSEVAKLKGQNGTNGTNGAAGASAFAPPPSGTVIKGGGVLRAEVSSADIALNDYAPLPFVPQATLDDVNPGRNLFFGDIVGLGFFGEQDTTACAGTAAAPVATPGNLCVYFASATGVKAASAIVYAGADTGADAAELSGFYVRVLSAASGTTQLHYVWVYTAP